MRVFRPAVEPFGKFDLFLTQRLAMRFGRVLLVRRAVSDVRADANEGRSLVGFRLLERTVECRDVVGIFDRLRVPAVRLVAPADILLVERERCVALDRDVVASEAASPDTPSIISPSLAMT